MTTARTVRRDWLRRQVEAGRVTAVGSYHFDDMHGAADRKLGAGLLVAISPKDYRERKAGVFYIGAHDFKSSCGKAWQGANGIVTLYVHGNCNYDLRVGA